MKRLENALLIAAVAIYGAVEWSWRPAFAETRDERVAARLAALPAAAAERLVARLPGGPAAPRIERWTAPVRVELVAGEASDRAGLEAAIARLSPTVPIELLPAGARGGDLVVYLVPSAAFDGYDQAPRAAGTAIVVRTFAASSGAIERGRVVIADDVVDSAARTRAWPRILARALGLARLELERDGDLEPLDLEALALLYRSDLELGATLPPGPPAAARAAR